MQAINHRFLDVIFPQFPPPAKLLHTVASVVPLRRCSTVTYATSAPMLPVLDLPGTNAETFLDYQHLFTSQRAESVGPIVLAALEGGLPTDFPRGTYYLIGPGMTADDLGSTVSPLDGHGYLRAFRFGAGGEVSYSARYVETKAVKEDRVERKWRFVRPGFFSLLKARRVAGPSTAKNVANTAVLSWAGRLFCLWEGEHPHEIEPSSLATIGVSNLIEEAERPREGGGGVVIGAGMMKNLGYAPKENESHCRIDAKRNRFLVLACNGEDLFLPHSNFTFYEFDSNFELKQKKEFFIKDQMMIHDWAFTDGHYILMANRTKFNLPGSLLDHSYNYKRITLSLAFGMEAMVPSELLIPYGRVKVAMSMESSQPVEWLNLNQDLQKDHLDLLEEKRYHALSRMTEFKHRAIRYVSKKVHIRSFQQGDLVLRKMEGSGNPEGIGKFSANWEGPYLIKEVLGPST